jgi:hypothetical protein
MNYTLSAASIAANAISAVANSLNYRDKPAKQAQSVGSLTNLHNFIDFSHFPFSQNSNSNVGYGEILKLITAPSFLLTSILLSVNEIIKAFLVISFDSLTYLTYINVTFINKYICT